MAAQVAGDLYESITGQLFELGRQLRQPNGYPFDPVALKRYLQAGIEGRFTPEADNIIRVNRSVKPAYPDWVKEVLHPELELTGPAEYPLAKVELWLHDEQKDEDSVINGQKNYEYLKTNNMLESCLGLSDLITIRSFGLDVFRRYFNIKTVFAWKSVVRHTDGVLYVPCLEEDSGEVLFHWFWLEHDFNSSEPALRFAK